MVKSPSESRRSGRLARMVVFAAATAMSMAAIGQARADVTDQLLDQLRAKGVLTHGEYSKLKARHMAEKADMDRPRHYSKDGVMVVPDDRYLTRLDKGIGFHIPGLVTKEGEVGAIDVKISGDLIFGVGETFAGYASGYQGGSHRVVGGLITASPNQPYNAISDGLLPSAIVLSIATNQMGYDLGFTVGAYIGGNNVEPGSPGGLGTNANSGGSPGAGGTPGIDLRQIFGTIGTPTFGTVKIGRDLGLFGSDAILNDATLLGAGAPFETQRPGNTTAGRIGFGYVYADWIPQVTYTTPDFNGFTASVGVFTPLTAQVNGVSDITSITGHELPMVQGQIKWKGNIMPGAGLTLSADALWQQQKNDTATATSASGGYFGPFRPNGYTTNSWGVDGFGKLDVDGFSFVAYGYYGMGLGTAALFTQGFDDFGNPRESWGGYVQGSYTWDKFTFGASGGFSQLTPTDGEFAFGQAPSLLRDNTSIIGFIRYQLTPWMAIQGEYSHSWETNWAGYQWNEDGFYLGTAWFF